MSNAITLYLSGPFRVENEKGEDITPKSAKAQGLLLLLACSESFIHTRGWLQENLWSDRGNNQAAGSLRQALVHIRSAFGTSQDVLQADRQKVGLDPASVRICEEDHAELAEGIKVRDPAFIGWLAAQRSLRLSRLAQRNGPNIIAPPARRNWVLALTRAGATSGPGRALEMLFTQMVGRSARENFLADIRLADTAEQSDFEVSIETAEIEMDQFMVRAVLTQCDGSNFIWANYAIVKISDAAETWSLALMQLHAGVFQALAQEVRKLKPRDPYRSDSLLWSAVNQIFNMTKDGVETADSILANSYEENKNGLFLAWRAQICAINRIERFSDDQQLLQDKSREYAQVALEQSPDNSMVLAMVANARLFVSGDAQGAFELAKRGVEINPANAMAWWAKSSAELYTGREGEALENANRALSLAQLSPYRFWWIQQVFGAMLFLKSKRDSIRVLESGANQCPNFRPPLRYLTMLYAETGQPDKALTCMDKLKKLEPDFSIDRLLEDRTYPASLIHRGSAFNFEKVRALA